MKWQNVTVRYSQFLDGGSIRPPLLLPVSLHMTSIMHLVDSTDTTKQQKFALSVKVSYFNIIIQYFCNYKIYNK